MKIKQTLFAILPLAGIFTMPAKGELNYLHLYVAGDATADNWNCDLAEEMIPLGNDCFLWDGWLKSGQFKFINTRGDWNSSVVADAPDLSFATGVSYTLVDNTGGGHYDFKFVNPKAGFVRMVVDLRNLKINFRRPVLGIVGDGALGWGDPTQGKKVIPVFADDNGNAQWSGQLRRGEVKFLAGDCDDWFPCYNAPVALDELWTGGHGMMYNDGQGSAEDFKYQVPVSGYYTLTFKNEGSDQFYGVDVRTENAPSLDGFFTGHPGRYLAGIDRDALRVHMARVPSSLYIGTSGDDCREIMQVSEGVFSSEVYLHAGEYYKLSYDPGKWPDCVLSPNTDVNISSEQTSNVSPMHGYSYTVPSDGQYVVTADFTGSAPALSAHRRIVSGVDGPISGSEVRVVVADGAIAVDGDYSSLVIYDVVGRKVGSASPCFVPSGVYLVMVDKNVFKITVK